MNNVIDEERYAKYKQYRLGIFQKLLSYISKNKNKYDFCPEFLTQPLLEMGTLIENYTNYSAVLSEDVEDPMKEFTQKRYLDEVNSYKTYAGKIGEYNDEGIYELIKEIYPGFGEKPYAKMSMENYSLYMSQFKKIENLISSLNSDIVPNATEDLRDLDVIDVDDRVGQIIDIEEFDDACRVETDFFMSEYEILIQRIDKIISTTEQGENDRVIKLSSDLKAFAESQMQEKSKWLEEYKKRKELKKKIKGKTQFVFGQPRYSDDECK